MDFSERICTWKKGQENQAEKCNADINLEITTIFLHDQDKICPSDSHLFDLSKDERLSHTFDQKRLWVTSVQAAISAQKQTSNPPAPRRSPLSIRRKSLNNPHHPRRTSSESPITREEEKCTSPLLSRATYGWHKQVRFIDIQSKRTISFHYYY